MKHINALRYMLLRKWPFAEARLALGDAAWINPFFSQCPLTAFLLLANHTTRCTKISSDKLYYKNTITSIICSKHIVTISSCTYIFVNTYMYIYIYIYIFTRHFMIFAIHINIYQCLRKHSNRFQWFFLYWPYDPLKSIWSNKQRCK